MLVKKTSKNRVTLPTAIVRQLPRKLSTIVRHRRAAFIVEPRRSRRRGARGLRPSPIARTRRSNRITGAAPASRSARSWATKR